MAESHGDNVESDSRRRKIRKGTRSCWECKKRKMKCVFADSGSPVDVEAICIGCQRRGTKCVGQEFEFVEGTKDSRKGRRRMGSQARVAKVEALVEQLIKKVGNGEARAIGDTTTAPPNGMPTPASIDLDSSRVLSSYKASHVRINSGAVVQ